MILKIAIKLLVISCFILVPQSTKAFDFSNNHYSAIQTVLKGKDMYSEEFGKPFSEAIKLNKSYNVEFLTEKLAPLLTEDSTSFFFYGKNFLTDYLNIKIESYTLKPQDIIIKDLEKFDYNLQIIELRVPNQELTANAQAKLSIKTEILDALIFRTYISHHLNILPPHKISKSDEDFVDFFIETHCVEKVTDLLLTIGSDSINVSFDKGYSLFPIKISKQNYRQNNEIKYFINGHYYDSDFYDNTINENIEISLIPLMKESSLSQYNDMISVELKGDFDVNNLQQTEGEFISLANHQLNYSIDPNNINYAKNIGFLQDRSSFKFSHIALDSPLPSRKELQNLLNYNIEYLGLFERNRPHRNLEASLFDDDSRLLLIYRLFSKLNSKNSRDKEIALHLDYLNTCNYKYNQSALFVDIENVEKLEDLNAFVNNWNSQNSSPQLAINHFQKFAKLFKLRNGIKLQKTDQIESPFREELDEEVEVETSNWENILTGSSIKQAPLFSDFISIVNPYSSDFSGIINFRHTNANYISAKLSDGTKIPIQYDSQEKKYYVLLKNYPAFGIDKINLSESKSKLKEKYKSKIKYNKKTGLISWQFKGDKLSYKKEALLIPFLKNGSKNIEVNYKTGKPIDKGPIFDSYIYKLNFESQDKATILVKIFKNKPVLNYHILSRNLKTNESIHIRFNFNTSPKSYSLDRYLQKENGYEKTGNQNLISSQESVFMINKTKLVFESLNDLKWEYNHESFNPYRTGFEKQTTDPTRLFLFIDGILDQQDDKSKSKEKKYNFSLQMGEEKDELKSNKNIPIITNNIKGIKPRKNLLLIDNPNINIVNIHRTNEKGYYILEVKNNSLKAEKANIESFRKKSVVYYCNFSGKKTGIVKGKIKFEPFELKTIRIRL